MVKGLPAMWAIWVGKLPWKRKWQLTPVLLPGESHAERIPAGYNPEGLKEWNMTEHTHARTHTHNRQVYRDRK